MACFRRKPFASPSNEADVAAEHPALRRQPENWSTARCRSRPPAPPRRRQLRVERASSRFCRALATRPAGSRHRRNWETASPRERLDQLGDIAGGHRVSTGANSGDAVLYRIAAIRRDKLVRPCNEGSPVAGRARIAAQSRNGAGSVDNLASSAHALPAAAARGDEPAASPRRPRYCRFRQVIGVDVDRARLGVEDADRSNTSCRASSGRPAALGDHRAVERRRPPHPWCSPARSVARRRI